MRETRARVEQKKVRLKIKMRVETICRKGKRKSTEGRKGGEGTNNYEKGKRIQTKAKFTSQQKEKK